MDGSKPDCDPMRGLKMDRFSTSDQSQTHAILSTAVTTNAVWTATHGIGS